jgi:hypothetical protein
MLCGSVLAACTPQTTDSAFVPVTLPPAYVGPAGATQTDVSALERGVPVKVSPLQQEAVVNGTMKWVKDPHSAAFGDMRMAKNRNGTVSVCGSVSARNQLGALTAMTPFVGILTAVPRTPEFVMVELGVNGRQRADVLQICSDIGLGSDGYSPPR